MYGSDYILCVISTCMAQAIYCVLSPHVWLVIGKLFKVKPVDSDDHRRIGARGSICLLHFCQSGVTLAFEVG